MGAFLSAISGAGEGAGRYGEQIRGLLEQRRGDFANLISKAAEQESDPQTRAALLQHSADLLSGKPIGQIAQKFSQTLDKRHQDSQALLNTVGPPPQAPPPQPGPAQPGQMPGTPQAAQAPPAAQPSSSPVQPGAKTSNEPTMPDLGQTPIPPLSPQAIAANAPSMTESLGMPIGMQIPGLPVPVDPQTVLRHAMQNPLWEAPANRPILLQAAQQELSHQEALRQALETKQATIAYAQNAIRVMKTDGTWDKLPDFYRSELQMAAAGVNPPSFPAGMVLPHLISTGTMGSQAPPGTKIFGTEQLVNPNERYRVMNIPAYGNIWQPEQAQIGIETTATGGREIINKQVPGAAGVIGPVSGAVNPSFAPTTSVQTAPGEAPITTVRRKGAVGGVSPAGAGGATPATIPPISGGTPLRADPLVKKEYDDWAAGGPAPTGRKLSAVQGYAAANNLPTPIAMSAKGASDLAAIEPVIQEITDLKKKLEEGGLNKRDTYELVPDFLRYSHGLGSTPHDDLFTSLSFEQLRSAAAAMKGMNSRAFPILTRALQHTPTLDRALGLMPDTPKTMYDKLNTMETILNQGRDAILADERKTGVTAIKPAGGSGTVQVISPEGVTGTIPAENLQKALNRGFKRVQ